MHLNNRIRALNSPITRRIQQDFQQNFHIRRNNPTTPFKILKKSFSIGLKIN